MHQLKPKFRFGRRFGDFFLGGLGGFFSLTWTWTWSRFLRRFKSGLTRSLLYIKNGLCPTWRVLRTGGSGQGEKIPERERERERERDLTPWSNVSSLSLYMHSRGGRLRCWVQYAVLRYWPQVIQPQTALKKLPQVGTAGTQVSFFLYIHKIELQAAEICNPQTTTLVNTTVPWNEQNFWSIN